MTSPVKATGGVSAGVIVLMGLQVFGMELGNYSSANLGSYSKIDQATQFFRVFIDLFYSKRDHRDTRLEFLFMEVLTQRVIYGG